MEDRQRFRAVLDETTGIGQWQDDPRWYRRCYQGLVFSYFTYDVHATQTSADSKQNWIDLRDYLHEHVHGIVDKKINPDWVNAARENQQLFGEHPCDPYAADVLSGNRQMVHHICEALGIAQASWFLRELVFAQVQKAIEFTPDHFTPLIPQLLQLLAENLVLRDRGLILLLDKYVSTTQQVNVPLKEASVQWWGNPWLSSNKTRWGGVTPATRQMVSEWLKSEFVEAFFAKLAQDGIGDRRRSKFWLKHVKSITNIHFALGPQALCSRDPELVMLRQKMKGLYTELKTSNRSNNAFIITLENLVVVEFGGMGNAFYAYAREKLPFDLSWTLQTTVDAPNSLKQQGCEL